MRLHVLLLAAWCGAGCYSGARAARDVNPAWRGHARSTLEARLGSPRVVAGVPLRFLVEAFGWRPVMGVSAALTAVLCLATWLRVRDDPAERGRLHAELRGLLEREFPEHRRENTP